MKTRKDFRHWVLLTYGPTSLLGYETNPALALEKVDEVAFETEYQKWLRDGEDYEIANEEG